MIPYMHRTKQWDDVVGYDQSATNSRIHVYQYPDGLPTEKLEIGYYEFHKQYRPIEAEELAKFVTAMHHVVQLAQTLPCEAPAQPEPRAPKTAEGFDLPRAYPKQILFDHLTDTLGDDIYNAIVDGNQAKVLQTLVDVQEWHAWAQQNGQISFTDDAFLYLQARFTA
jgi:hypothetical protein